MISYHEARRHRRSIKAQQLPLREGGEIYQENEVIRTTVFVIGAIIFCLLPVCSCLIILATVFPEALSHVMVIRANDYASDYFTLSALNLRSTLPVNSLFLMFPLKDKYCKIKNEILTIFISVLIAVKTIEGRCHF